MKRLAIIGAGELGQQISHMATSDKKYDIIGYFDDFQNNALISNYPILGKIDDVYDAFLKNEFDCVLLGIGYKNMQFRKTIFEKISKEIPFGKLIHSTSYIDPEAVISDGVIIFPGCIIDQYVEIKENVLMQLGCNIAHNTIICEHSYLSPSISLAGYVTIEECCNIGINTIIIDHITLGANVQTGGGTVVINNISEAGIYVGNPARRIR